MISSRSMKSTQLLQKIRNRYSTKNPRPVNTKLDDYQEFKFKQKVNLTSKSIVDNKIVSSFNLGLSIQNQKSQIDRIKPTQSLKCSKADSIKLSTKNRQFSRQKCEKENKLPVYTSKIAKNIPLFQSRCYKDLQFSEKKISIQNISEKRKELRQKVSLQNMQCFEKVDQLQKKIKSILFDGKQSLKKKQAIGKSFQKQNIS